MKRLAIFTIIAIAAVVGAVIFTHADKRRQERTPLVAVYRQLKAWEPECSSNGHLQWPRLFVKCRTLDTSACPQPFSLAWSNFLAAVPANPEHATDMMVAILDDVPAQGSSSSLVAQIPGGTGAANDPKAAVQAIRHFWIEYDIGPKDVQ